MKHTLALAASLAAIQPLVGAAGPKAYTYQTFSNGSVQLATTTLGSSSSGASQSTQSAYYTLNTSDLAYPTYTSIPSAVAQAPAGPGLLNSSQFVSYAVELVFKGKNANSTNCQRCKDIMVQVQQAARADQDVIGRIAEPFCNAVSLFIPYNICVGLFRTGGPDVGASLGSFGTDMQGQDGQVLCAFTFGVCELPPPPTLDLKTFFNGTTKPPPKTLVPSTKEPLKVLHISDYHLDPRYVVGSEANCSVGSIATLCCRVFPYSNLSAPISQPASIFGDYLCDTPEPLATSVFRAVPNVTSHPWKDFAFGIFTGDLVSHDIWELTPNYVVANELLSYQNFFDGMEGVKVYPTLGNHDTYPQGLTAFPAFDAFLPGNASYRVQEQYNYENVSAAYQHYGWLTAEEAQQIVNSGLGIYRAKTPQNLTIISLNSDVWYQINLYAYISANDVDPTGIFKTLVQWLSEAEAKDEPVWLIQHVNIGGSTSYEAFPAASDLYYQIIDRFNNTIRATFFGHTHNDEFGVFYTNNGTVQSSDTAASVGYIGPSVTPYTNLNAGFRYYLVDPDTFAVIDSINYYANVSNANQWAQQGDVAWQFEYSARATYDPDKKLLGTNPNSPLTPAFWHQVADNIKNNATYFKTYTDYRNKLYRPYPAPSSRESDVIKCGLNSMSVPLFEKCLGSMASLNSIL